jgi:transposase
LVRVVDAFVASLNLTELGFSRTVAAVTGRPGFHPGDMLRLYIWGYLNQVGSSRHLERPCVRDLEALWLPRQLAPDYRTIAAFRHDAQEAIVGASAAFILFCRESGLISGRQVALDGTKMQAVPARRTSPALSAWCAISLTLNARSPTTSTASTSSMSRVAQGYDDQPAHRQAFSDAIASLGHRKDQLVRRQQELEKRDEKVLVLASHRQSRWATAAHRSSRLTTSRAWSMSTAVSSSTTTSRMRQTTASFSIGCQWRPCRCWMLISSVCSPTAATRRSGDRRMRARQH